MPQDRSFARRLSRHALTACALVVSLASAPAVAAGSFASDLDGLRRRWESRSADPRWDATAEEALVGDLDALVVRFRSEGGQAGSARSLRRLLEDVHRRYAEWLKRMQDGVIAADGDLEAAQDSPEWRAREALALRTLYLLNWIHLEAATRYERSDRRHRQWLEQAAEGFGQFAAVEDDPELAAESLFGRGLCQRHLGRLAGAVADFRRALDVPAPAELAPRIRAALVETLIDADRISEALETSRALLRRHRTPAAEFLRAKTLLLALASSELPPSRRTASRREVIDLVTRLERRGGNWTHLARRLAAAGITRPEEWLGERASPTVQWVLAEALRSRGKYRKALPLYEAVAAAQKPARPEVLLALGACQFRLQMFSAALATLERARQSKGSGAIGADIAYLRFKSAEALYHTETTPENAERLRAAAREYVAGFPAHPQTFEASFRLGEIERSEGNLLAAATAFDAVTGDPAFHLRALFQAAQCYVEELESRAGKHAKADDQLTDRALERLQAFLEEAAAFRRRRGARAADAAVLVPMQARARVLGALLLARRQTPADLEKALAWLADFAGRFPQESELRRQASGVRAVALLGLGRFAEAHTALQAFLSGRQRTGRDYRLLRRLGVRSLELAETERAAGNGEAARILERTALDVYQELLRAVERGAVSGESPEGLRRLISRLRAQDS